MGSGVFRVYWVFSVNSINFARRLVLLDKVVVLAAHEAALGMPNMESETHIGEYTTTKDLLVLVGLS